ncbi:hypothetical protein BC834DRAFT_848361 [Gloeopeniophorella convolvens]|nr:hypothetical protein BC834DRAFT_848361 [Gloeopeniophorella convolvens]
MAERVRLNTEVRCTVRAPGVILTEYKLVQFPCDPSVHIQLRAAGPRLKCTGGEWTQMDNAKLKSHAQSRRETRALLGQGVAGTWRMAEDCRIQFSSLEHRDSEQRGHWTLEEEAQLVEIIQDLGAEGRSETSQRFWPTDKVVRVCRNHAAPALNRFRESQLKPAMLNGGQKRFGPGDDYILCEIASLHASSERDIDWGALKDPAWNAWNGSVLKKKWWALRKRVNLEEEELPGENDI